jgi:hypothetical protein
LTQVLLHLSFLLVGNIENPLYLLLSTMVILLCSYSFYPTAPLCPLNIPCPSFLSYPHPRLWCHCSVLYSSETHFLAWYVSENMWYLSFSDLFNLA